MPLIRRNSNELKCFECLSFVPSYLSPLSYFTPEKHMCADLHEETMIMIKKAFFQFAD